jgi:hypothetical protein
LIGRPRQRAALRRELNVLGERTQKLVIDVIDLVVWNVPPDASPVVKPEHLKLSAFPSTRSAVRSTRKLATQISRSPVRLRRPTPPNISYPWSISVISPTLADESKMYQLGLVFLFQTPSGGHTDIGGFYDLGAFLVV